MLGAVLHVSRLSSEAMDALLFRLSRVRVNGPPDWKICADDWVDFYQGRGWFLLGRESEITGQRSADIQAVRQAEEARWAPRHRWRRRSKRKGTTGE